MFWLVLKAIAFEDSNKALYAHPWAKGSAVRIRTNIAETGEAGLIGLAMPLLLRLLEYCSSNKPVQRPSVFQTFGF